MPYACVDCDNLSNCKKISLEKKTEKRKILKVVKSGNFHILT